MELLHSATAPRADFFRVTYPYTARILYDDMHSADPCGQASTRGSFSNPPAGITAFIYLLQFVHYNSLQYPYSNTNHTKKKEHKKNSHLHLRMGVPVCFIYLILLLLQPSPQPTVYLQPEPTPQHSVHTCCKDVPVFPETADL